MDCEICGAEMFDVEKHMAKLHPIKHGRIPKDELAARPKEYECYFCKFGFAEQCENPGRWRGAVLGNFSDDWTWCDEHKPFRGARPIK